VIIVSEEIKKYTSKAIFVNDNDNDKWLGLMAKANQPDHKKYNTPKI